MSYVHNIGVFDEKERGVVVFEAMRAPDGEVDVLDVYVSGTKVPRTRAQALVRRHGADLDRRFRRSELLRANGSLRLYVLENNKVVRNEPYTIGPHHTATGNAPDAAVIDWSKPGGETHIVKTDGDIKKIIGKARYDRIMDEIQARDMFPVGHLDQHSRVR